MAFLSVVVMWGCPTTWSKTAGRYFLAETIKFFMGAKLIHCRKGKKTILLTRR
jgi:hypothetical protein